MCFNVPLSTLIIYLNFSFETYQLLTPVKIYAVLSMDFEKEINEILEAIPDYGSGGRRTMLFSATMTSKVEKLQRASLHNPVRVEVSTKFQTPKKLSLIHI